MEVSHTPVRPVMVSQGADTKDQSGDQQERRKFLVSLFQSEARRHWKIKCHLFHHILNRAACVYGSVSYQYFIPATHNPPYSLHLANIWIIFWRSRRSQVITRRVSSSFCDKRLRSVSRIQPICSICLAMFDPV